MQGTGGSLVVSAGGRQQRLPMPVGCAPHSKPEQHTPASPVPQDSPGGVQPGVRHRPLRHSRPEQQPSLDVHISSSRRHAQVPVADIIPVGRLQRAPPQQSMSVRQLPSRAWQVHRPLVQSCQPQQSSCDVHMLPVLRQQVRTPPGCSPQVAPLQQVWPVVQVAPSATHIPPSPPSPEVPSPEAPSPVRSPVTSAVASPPSMPPSVDIARHWPD